MNDRRSMARKVFEEPDYLNRKKTVFSWKPSMILAFIRGIAGDVPSSLDQSFLEPLDMNTDASIGWRHKVNQFDTFSAARSAVHFV